MKINCIDGSEFDTDKLSDIKAIVTEKSKELLDICQSNNIPCLLLTESGIGSGLFSNVHVPVEKCQQFWTNVSGTLLAITKDRICLAFRKPKE